MKVTGCYLFDSDLANCWTKKFSFIVKLLMEVHGRLITILGEGTTTFPREIACFTAKFLFVASNFSN